MHNAQYQHSVRTLQCQYKTHTSTYIYNITPIENKWVKYKFDFSDKVLFNQFLSKVRKFVKNGFYFNVFSVCFNLW